MKLPEWNVNRRKLSRRALLSSALIAGGCAADQGKNEIDRIQVEQKRLMLPRWTAGDLRIAFLTDWHLSEQSAKNRMVRAMNIALEFKPDMILFGGDYMSAKRTWRQEWGRESLAPLKSYRGLVAGVYGNHDYTGRNEIARLFAESGHTLLINQVIHPDGITLIGLDDGITGAPEMELVGLHEEKKNVIALFHEPDYAEGIVDQTSLTLAGHTHGGQICLPGGFPLHLPRGGRKYVGGEYRFGDSLMYVSRGLGTSGPAVRAYCRPEVSILDLSAA